MAKDIEAKDDDLYDDDFTNVNKKPIEEDLNDDEDDTLDDDDFSDEDYDKYDNSEDGYDEDGELVDSDDDDLYDDDDYDPSDETDDDDDLYDADVDDDPSDVTDEEISNSEKEYEKSIVDEDTKLDDIDEHQKELFLKKVKSSDINWDEIEFEDDEKIMPKLDQENMNVFIAVSSDIFDKGVVETYIDIARNEIESWKDLKARMDSADKNELSVEDLKYYESATKLKDDARMIIASVQSEGKKLAKEFEEDKIAESVIKSVTLGSLRDFIVGKFKFNSSWGDNVYDATKDIETDLLNCMYVAPMFKRYIERDNIKSNKALHNRFGAHYFNVKLSNFVYAIQSYIKNLDEAKQQNLDVKTIVDRDFKVMEYFRIFITYAFKYGEFTSNEIMKDVKFSEKDEETFNTVVNPGHKYDDLFKELNKIATELITSLKDISVLAKLSDLAKCNVVNDPLYTKLDADINTTSHEDMITKIATLFPEEIEAIHIGNWGKVYIFMQKYDRYFTLKKMEECISDKTIDDVKKTAMAFYTMTSLLADQFMFMYGEFITDLQEFVKEKIYTKESRPIVFGSIMNSMILQHELGFKTPFVPGESDSGDKLYDLAKERFDTQYEFIVGDKDDDILLKKANLSNIHEMYLKSLIDLINGINKDLSFVINNNTVDGVPLTIAMENEFLPKVSKKKTSKKRRR